MNKKVYNIHSLLRRGKFLIILFCLNLFFSIMGFIALKLNIGTFPMAVTLIVLSILSIILAAAILIANISKLEHTENYLLYGNYKDESRIKLFHNLLKENLFEYHFQPIISAKSGEIFAYEALMRSGSNFNMSPLEILDIAYSENRLYDIELYTYHNTLKIYKENLEFFHNKKLFINSVSSHPIKESDFELLIKNFGSHISNLVIEISEGTLLNDSDIQSIRSRLQKSNSQLALDDYGSGFSNESTLLKTNPDYIKIDRNLMRNINTDTKKQHLVSNIANFASQFNIMTIAEGIETFEEFTTVVKMDIDYIQGFYTAKPAPYFLQNLPQNHIDVIMEINKQKSLKTVAG